MFNKNHGLVLLTLLLLLVSVSSVCAADPDNITDFDNNCLSDVNCSNTLTNNLNSNDVIYNDSNIDCCGAIAFQSVLKENGINITLEEANTVIHSVNGTTSMQGLIDGAKAYNLTAIPIKINISNLQPNSIVHMNIGGTGHWAIFNNITNEIIYLNDNNLDLDEFKKVYTNQSMIILYNDNFSTNEFNGSILNNTNQIVGSRWHKKIIRYKTIRVPGLIKKCGWHLTPVITPHGAKFSQWRYIYGVYYVPGMVTKKVPVYQKYYVSDDRLTNY